MPLNVTSDAPGDPAVDAGGDASGDVQTLTTARSGITPYDFRRPTKLSRENVRLLQVTFDTFARRLTTLLTSGLRQICHVSIDDLSQRSYEDYISSRPMPTLLVPLNLPEVPTTGVLEFSLPIALAAVDHMLGGPGGSQPDRTLTDIETPLVRGLLEQMTGVLSYVFEPIMAIRPTIGAIEYNPQFVQVAAPSDPVLVAEFAMQVGAEESMLTLCIPLPPLLPLLVANHISDEAADAVAARDAAQAREMMSRRLGAVPVDVQVQFTPTTLSPAQVLEMAVGDVIELNHRTGRPLDVIVDDTTYAHAVAGRSGNRLAVLITETV